MFFIYEFLEQCPLFPFYLTHSFFACVWQCFFSPFFFCCLFDEEWDLLVGCIRVFCRVRPFLSIDKRRIQLPLSIESEKLIIKSGAIKKEFAFDKVFPQEASQGQSSTVFFPKFGCFDFLC